MEASGRDAEEKRARAEQHAPLVRGPSLLEDLRMEFDAQSPAGSRASPSPNTVAQRRAGGRFMPGDDEGDEGGEGGRGVRGLSLLQEELNKAIAEEGEAEEEEGGAEDRRRGAVVVDASALEQMIKKSDEATKGKRKALGKSSSQEDLDTLIGTRASQVSVESLGDAHLVLFAGTWNVANKSPPRGDSLRAWLGFGEAGGRGEPDVYAVGLQEVDTSVQSAVLLETKRGQQWKEHIHSHMLKRNRGGGAGGDAGPAGGEAYLPVATRQMGSVLLCVYAKRKHLDHISEVSSAIVTVGLMGVMGNKGAVAVRMRLYHHTLCLVCAHLAAGEEANSLERRCNDYAEVNEKVTFSACVMRCAALAGSAGEKQQTMFFSPSLTIASHKIVVWMGDLNFRVKLSYRDAKSLIAQGELGVLRRKDELLGAMAGGRVFAGFDEGLIEFKPTYKFDEGSREYDTSHKMRVPSWTDRVLWKGSSMLLLDYSTLHDILHSDHRPVRAVLALKHRARRPSTTTATSNEGSFEGSVEGVYEVEEERSVLDTIRDQPLVRMASGHLNMLGDAVRSSTTLDPAAMLQSLDVGLGGLFSTSQEQQPHIPESPSAPAAPGAPAAVEQPRVDVVVSPENFESTARERLGVVMQSLELEWKEAAVVDGVSIKASAAGGTSAVWIRGDAVVEGGVEGLVEVLKDPLRRQDWDQTFVEGGMLQKYDDSHSIVRFVRCQKASSNDQESPHWDWALLQSHHVVPAPEGGGRGDMQVLVWQSVQHRLLPQNPKFQRGHLGFEAYLMTLTDDGKTSVTVLLQMSVQEQYGGALVPLGEDLVMSLARLGQAA